ncbi:MAG: SRPBCC domain-containing protein [Chloroflexi bacterium]|nr:SRPBCC domain-containing protein [Chloroflexota bacterium]
MPYTIKKSVTIAAPIHKVWATTIQKPTTLEYTWRQHEWKKEWKDSLVKWKLKAKGDTTIVKLTHIDFPNKEERDGHDEGWDVYWLQPMTIWLRTSD